MTKRFWNLSPRLALATMLVCGSALVGTPALAVKIVKVQKKGGTLNFQCTKCGRSGRFDISKKGSPGITNPITCSATGCGQMMLTTSDAQTELRAMTDHEIFVFFNMR